MEFSRCSSIGGDQGSPMYSYIGEGELSLLAFGDASGHAFAAVIFASIKNAFSANVQLWSARVRIAPRKSTIPRLELLGTLVATRFGGEVFKPPSSSSFLLDRFDHCACLI